jgi:hypothetical protein
MPVTKLFIERDNKILLKCLLFQKKLNNFESWWFPYQLPNTTMK